MTKSWKRAQREMLGTEGSISEKEHQLFIILADIIEATPPGQRSTEMTMLLNDVRQAQLAHPAVGR